LGFAIVLSRAIATVFVVISFRQKHFLLKSAALRILRCVHIFDMIFLQDDAFAVDNHVTEMHHLIICESVNIFIDALNGPRFFEIILIMPVGLP